MLHNRAIIWGLYCRKPQTTNKAKNGIQDWHLMVFVSILILVDVIVLSFYTLLEGVVDKFGVLRVPSKEKLSSVTGVSRVIKSIHDTGSLTLVK